MSADRQIRITLQRGGRDTPLDMPFGPISIGSGSHCDVRLLPDEAAERQLRIEPGGHGLRIQSLARDPRCTLQGLPFDEIVVDAPTRLELGALSLTVELLDARSAKADTGAALRKNVRQGVMLFALAIGYYYALRTPPDESSLRASVAPPVLFDDADAASCPQTDRAAARVFAEEQFVLAESKRERSPFRIHDGVQAVPLYETAAACFRASQQHDWSDEASQSAAALKRELAETLHTHRVRLEWFLGRDKLDAAQSEVFVLRALLRGRADPYSQWLAAVECELASVLASRNKEET